MAVTVAVSVVIIAKNEEQGIEECLKSVYGWADEIILVDDCSTDKTVAVAGKYARVLTRKMENEGVHRNWAYAQARNRWVLSLDADESVTPELKEEIAGAITSDAFDCYDIPLRTFFGNYWVRHGGWYPAPKVRLFLRDKMRYEEVEVHPRVLGVGRAGHLHADIIHKGYPDLEHLFGSVNRQTTLEASKWIKTNRRMTCGHMLWRAVDRFFRRYIRKQAYKDGMYGFVISYCDSLYQFLSYVKYREMLRQKK
jgi:glycosyltransferase involved in cell wall biosynthesis